MTQLESSIQKSIELLESVDGLAGESRVSVDRVKEIVETVKSIVFPGFFGASSDLRTKLELLHFLLRGQIKLAINDEENNYERSEDLCCSFIEGLAEIKRLLYTDVQAIQDNDPAVKNLSEVISCYPVVQAMLHYRTAHALLVLGVPVIPRIMTELAHSRTGIDIHPGARIGEYFAIDHGTGVVIGETCIIGDHVTLYQGVTLGAKNFSYDLEGRPVNKPRHPIVEDHVTIYSNSSVLGRVTIGHHSVIGGNLWLTHDVPPCSKVLQGREQKAETAAI